MIALLSAVFTAVLNLLPDSPFQTVFGFMDEFDFLPYLNWFVPFDNALTITRVWAVAVFAYYMYDIVSTTVREFIIDKLG